MKMNSKNESMQNSIAERTEQIQTECRKVCATKRRISRQQANLDYIEWRDLPMPALTSLKARADKRSGKYKKKTPNLVRPGKEQTKVCAQKLRHADAARTRRAALDVKRQNQRGLADADSLALA